MRTAHYLEFSFLILVCCTPLFGQTETIPEIRIGMIGLDTSHAPAFTRLFNSDDATGATASMRVVAAYPGGSQDIASRRDRLEKFTNDLREMDVQIVDSVESLLPLVDVILLESVDGRKHLPQVAPVFAAGKPVFIDKPLAGDLPDALAIDLLSKRHAARWFSSSSLRFSSSIHRFRSDDKLANNVRGAQSWGPCSLEPTHSDLYWYGVHGVETLYTAMGMGCTSVSRTDGDDIVVVGRWHDGRIGSFRGIMGGKADHGLVVFGQDAIHVGGKHEGYQSLVQEIAKFFRGGAAPVSNEETLELFTFMAASDLSKASDGQVVKLSDVREEALLEAKRRLARLAAP